MLWEVDVMWVLCVIKPAVKQCCKCITKSFYGSVLQLPLIELLTKVIDLHLNKLQSDTHRRPAQELFVFEIEPSLPVHGQHPQQRSSAAVTSWHVTDQKVPAVMAQAGLPRRCRGPVPFHCSGDELFCSPSQTWKISPFILLFKTFSVLWRRVCWYFRNEKTTASWSCN